MIFNGKSVTNLLPSLKVKEFSKLVRMWRIMFKSTRAPLILSHWPTGVLFLCHLVPYVQITPPPLHSIQLLSFYRKIFPKKSNLISLFIIFSKHDRDLLN